MKTNRVAITGLGIVCSNGHNLDQTWESITAGKPGISKIEQTDVSHLAVQIAGEVKNFKLDEEILSEREQPRYDRFIHLGLSASHEAWKRSGLHENNPYDATRMGAIM